jgi:hypothetical protein
MNNVIEQTRPPATRNPSGLDGIDVWVMLSIPEGAEVVIDSIYPRLNIIGAQLLSRLLKARIMADGVQVTDATRSLELNRSLYSFRVSALGPALSAVISELGELNLLEWSQVSWEDKREGVLRMAHPKTGVFTMLTEAERKAEGKFLEALERLAGCLNEEGHGNNQ